ncbi:MAG: magnesium transporter [Aquificaceae bacterium]|nr:MAG: magnesium transporter [Aquificaceae bacterium]
MNTVINKNKAELVGTLSDAIESGSLIRVQRMLNALHPAEIAHLLESSPLQQRKIAWELINKENEGSVLVELGEDVRSSLVEEMNTGEVIEAVKDLDADDMADFLQSLPDTVISKTLKGMGRKARERVEAVLDYDEDTAGGMMDTQAITIRDDITIEVVLRYLRMQKELPSHTDNLIVVDNHDTYLGILPLSKLLTSQPDDSVAERMNAEHDAILATTPSHDVTVLFEDRDLISAPVIDKNRKFLGRITIDDVVDVIRDEGDHSMMSMAGLNEEEDLFAPVLPSVKSRALWLGTNLATAFLAAWVVSQFTETIESAVALAVLMGIVPSMGGIAGSQTLTLAIRGIAVGQLVKSNTLSLLNKELILGLINGLLWAFVVFLISAFAFNNISIGIVIAIAMFINLLIAPIAGVVLPLLLRRFNIDPALAGGVVLTTVTDVVGYAAVLGLAALTLPFLNQFFT